MICRNDKTTDRVAFHEFGTYLTGIIYVLLDGAETWVCGFFVTLCQLSDKLTGAFPLLTCFMALAHFSFSNVTDRVTINRRLYFPHLKH